MCLRLNFYYLQRYAVSRSVFASITEALKQLSTSPNALEQLTLAVHFHDPVDFRDEEQEPFLPQEWFEEWLLMDDVLSNSSLAIPTTTSPVSKARKANFKAVVVLNYEETITRPMPSPGNVKHALLVLSQLQTLEVTR